MRIEIPEYLAHLPVDKRGYPIPYFVPIVDGEAEFKYGDPHKVDICLKYNKCWVCGRKIKLPAYVITGPVGRKNNVVSDLPMHERCARYSLIICPHMYIEKTKRFTDDDEGNDMLHVHGKPSEIYLIRIDKFKVIRAPSTQKVIRFREVTSEKYIYKNNMLTKENI